MELMNASAQWSTRPADQRFWTLEEMHAATSQHRRESEGATVLNNDLRVEAVNGEINLIGRTGSPATLTSWAFGQLANRAHAPAGYLQTLPATLAAQNLNHGLKANTEDTAKTRLMLHRNGGYFVRAVTSEKYTRIWNNDITQRLVEMGQYGWTTPPARPCNIDNENVRYATKEQAALSLTVKEGDPIGPAGLYASFEDMFAFLVHPDRVIDDGTPEGLLRGFFVWNSEVGKSSFGVMKFAFRGACGNHIVWGAKDVQEIKIIHIGDADDRCFQQLGVELRKYADQSAGDDEAKIASWKRFKLGGKPEDVVNMIFDKGFMPRKVAQQAIDAVVPEVDGDPTSAWGFAQGVTRLSQKAKNADARVALDRAAGKILEVAF